MIYKLFVISANSYLNGSSLFGFGDSINGLFRTGDGNPPSVPGVSANAEIGLTGENIPPLSGVKKFGVAIEKGVNGIAGLVLPEISNLGISKGGGACFFSGKSSSFIGVLCNSVVPGVTCGEGLSRGLYFRFDESGKTCFTPFSSVTIRFDTELFHLFLIALSVRPGKSFTIVDHFPPIFSCCSNMSSSSSWVHSLFTTVGLR